MRIARLLMLFSVLVACATAAEVVRIEGTSRVDIAGGKPYGVAGPYEKLSGRIHFEIDPGLAANRIITDIQYAPRNSAGRVEFSSDFSLIKPKNTEAGNGTVLVDSMNRGRKRVFRYFNGTAAVNDPSTEAHMGDGFLLEKGYSLLWVGWQFDVPRRNDLMRVYPPVASEGGTPIFGLVRSDLVVQEPVFDHSLGDRGHVPYAVADPDDPRNVLTVRDTPTGERTVVPRDRWQFGRLQDGRMVADRTRVYLTTGFEPDKVYEVVFISRDPPVAGVGLAALRDAVSHLKYDSPDELSVPQGAIERAIAFGDSQAGRMLRTFLYDGFNEDEAGRKSFDGLIAHTGSNARGSFNQRFAQPSRAVDASFYYPNDLFPFSDTMQVDPVTGANDSLLARLKPPAVPKVFYTNSSTEYWRLPTALIHTTVDGASDVPPAETSRIYLFSGSQHVPALLPQTHSSGLRVGNPNDYTLFLRSLLVAMDRWVEHGTPPPPSRYPRLADGTLVPLGRVRFPVIPRVRVPAVVSRGYRLDYGPRFQSDGVVTQEPPLVQSTFPFFVPQVDADGNEIAGLHTPELAVPLATHTGWNPYSPIASQGTYIPFARSRAEREASGDARLSIEERYASREQYLGLVAGAALALIEDGYILEEDLARVLRGAGRHWDYRMSGARR
jgi:hypothetical protein